MTVEDPAAWHACIVTETYPPEINGVALTLRQLVQGLSARGHAVSLVRLGDRGGARRSPQAPRAPRPGNAVPLRECRDTDGYLPPDPDTDVLQVPGVPLPRYAGLQLGLPAGTMLAGRWTARRPDVVYVATEGPLGWSAVRVAARMGIPVMSGYHTNFDRYMTHYGAGWLRGAAAWYLRRFHNGTAATLVATEDLRDGLAAAGYRNLHVLGRGVDTRRFAPSRRSAALRAAWGLAAGDLAVLYVGRVAAEKNLPLALEAYRAMQRAAPSRLVLRLVVVGDGPLRAAFQGAHPDVVFCGVQQGDALAAHYASGDVFLFPSETETFGNVTLEAMASGLAVVAYDYAAARAHITHAENGLLVPYRNAGAFIEQATTLARGDSLVRLRRSAREAAMAAQWPRVVERFERILRGAGEVRVDSRVAILPEEVARR
jgi:glycosyltransferase involved in cell wall biosynthesis